MELIADLHTHSLASTHAYSTIQEMSDQAVKLGYKAMAITDHAPQMPDAPHEWYFANLSRCWPDILPSGLLLLKGAEVNGLDKNGNLDLDDWFLERLDWVVVSQHRGVLEELDYEESTNFWLTIAENPLVDMIGHSEQERYFCDYDRVTKAFAQNNKVVELNANSASVRPGNEENMRNLIVSCKRNNTRVSVNSDAHSIYVMDNKQHILELLDEVDFPEELVINSSMERFIQELKRHKRAIVQRVDVEGLL